VVLGQLLYLWLFNPLTSETNPLFQLLPASLAACLVPAALYALSMRGAARARPVAAPAAGASVDPPRRLVAPNT
jgi:hypothetical protein